MSIFIKMGRVNISWVTEQIAVSGAFLNEDIPYLKRAGIDAIVDVRSEYSDNKELIEGFELEFLNIKVDDRYSPTLKQLERIFNFIEPLLDKGKRVLIHCQNGCGRSPLVAIATLTKRRMNIADAVGLVEDKHPIVSFTPQQERFIYNELKDFSHYKRAV